MSERKHYAPRFLLPLVLSYMTAEVPLVLLRILLSSLLHKALFLRSILIGDICISGVASNTRIAERYHCVIFFYQLPLTVKHIILLTRSVLWQRLCMQVPTRAYCVIILLFPQSHAVIIKKRKINSVQLIVLICINQRVSSLNKWCLLNFLASIPAGALLCIFVDWAKHVQRPTEAAFLKPGGENHVL